MEQELYIDYNILFHDFMNININIISLRIIYLLIIDISIFEINFLFLERWSSIIHFNHKNELRCSKIKI